MLNTKRVGPQFGHVHKKVSSPVLFRKLAVSSCKNKQFSLFINQLVESFTSLSVTYFLWRGLSMKYTLVFCCIVTVFCLLSNNLPAAGQDFKVCFVKLVELCKVKWRPQKDLNFRAQKTLSHTDTKFVCWPSPRAQDEKVVFSSSLPVLTKARTLCRKMKTLQLYIRYLWVLEAIHHFSYKLLSFHL